MATSKNTASTPCIPPEEDPNSPFEGLFHLLRRCVHSYDTDIESICHYQDVFGHSCEEDHEKAAEGEYKEVFYRLYEKAYGAVEMVKFDRKHSVYYRNLRDRIEALECDIEDHLETENDLRQKIQSRDKDISHASETIENLRQELNANKDETKKGYEVIFNQNKEIMRLKAKLFDLMERTEDVK